MTAAAQRLLSSDLMAESVPEDGSSTVLTTTWKVLGADGVLEVGLWAAGPGSDVDIEIDEVFLVLNGSGTVTFDDGSRIELAPGTLVRLHAGDRTTWVVTDRLHKLYITPTLGDVK
jgi:uncharacterized cupin superfamily protein